MQIRRVIDFYPTAQSKPAESTEEKGEEKEDIFGEQGSVKAQLWEVSSECEAIRAQIECEDEEIEREHEALKALIEYEEQYGNENKYYYTRETNDCPTTKSKPTEEETEKDKNIAAERERELEQEKEKLEESMKKAGLHSKEDDDELREALDNNIDTMYIIEKQEKEELIQYYKQEFEELKAQYGDTSLPEYKQAVEELKSSILESMSPYYKQEFKELKAQYGDTSLPEYKQAVEELNTKIINEIEETAADNKSEILNPDEEQYENE